MPIKIGKKTYRNFAAAVRAETRRGIRSPKAYVATIERKQRKK